MSYDVSPTPPREVIDELENRIALLEADNAALKATVWHLKGVRDEQLAAITAERNQLAEDINKLREFVGAQLAAIAAERNEGVTEMKLTDEQLTAIGKSYIDTGRPAPDFDDGWLMHDSEFFAICRAVAAEQRKIDAELDEFKTALEKSAYIGPRRTT